MPRNNPVDECMLRDRARLGRLRKARKTRELERLLSASVALRRARREGVPALSFDEALPITARKTEIQAAIRDHPVVVVCGETGSGKSTQLPKLCLEIGRGIDGYIGHTQPRRVAARAIAGRLAEELGGEVGGHAGYKFRFAEELSERSYMKVLTDGMLLAELETDRLLEQYDTLIIDEAHERSLNIDFLLGFLKGLLPRRPELRVIITSATIDPAGFSRFFDDAPVIEVSGRMYPVEVRYRPFDHQNADAGERNLEVALLHAVDELSREGPGDILVFLPGEFDIHKAAGLLRRRHYRNTEILPLYARLSTREQQRIFHPGGARRIVLATNVAETSITVPGIRYVIDSGLARVSRYRAARQVQALPIEPVSKASARQRAGRCGREAAGICIRLYDEQDFEAREEFTAPEVQRTSLASVILTMHKLRLGEVREFPFIEPPPEPMVKAGYRLLEELGAVDETRGLTPTGERLARIPADPRIGRMLLAAAEHQCASEVLTIAAALSIQDPRDYPADALERARQAHAAWRHHKSDFLSLLLLWERYRRDTRDLSHRRRARYCRERYLSIVRMREWRNVRDQLKGIARELNIPLNTSAAPEPAVHKALLTGLLGNIAQRHTDHEYLGTQGKKLFIHPSSSLFKARPKWLMCAELVQTSRLYARTAAAIDPAWVEGPAAHLVKRQYLEPAWDTKRGEVVAREQVTLFGLTLVSGRTTSFSKIDPTASREVFIRQGIVTGDLRPLPGFLEHNMRRIRQAEEIEQRTRRRGIVIDDERLYAFYDQRLPADVMDARSLRRWLERAPRAQVDALQLDAESARAEVVDEEYPNRFPDHLDLDGNHLPLRYRFEPGHPYDGVTVTVPAPLVRQLQPEPLSWLVPGLLAEKMTALIKGLPKARRRGVGPAGDAALLCLGRMKPLAGESLRDCMGRTLKEHKGIDIPSDAWDEQALPAHLRMNIEVLDAGGEVVAHGRDVEDLQGRIPRPTAEPGGGSGGRPSWLAKGLTDWSFDDLPESFEYRQSGVRLRSFVALRDDGDSVAIALFDREDDARESMARGLHRLLRLRLAARVKYLAKNLPQGRRMCLNFASVGSCDALTQDIIAAAFARAVPAEPWSVRSRAAFEETVAAAGENLVPAAAQICRSVAPALEELRACMSRLDDLPSRTRTDIAQQLDLLVFPGFVSHTPPERLKHYERYLKGVRLRIDRCLNNPEQDLAKLEKIRIFWKPLLLAHPAPPDPVPAPLSDFRWLLEEYRISLFAQELKTAQPVSAKRLENQWRIYQASRHSS
ncbi:MAG: ATP-dependent RNA helicase HrpA [Arenicellales bacterium]